MIRTLAAIVAHPDDDAYGIAALVALHKDDPDFRFFLVHATDGEGGAIAEGSDATPETLGAVRREEDRRAWITLGRTPYRHEWFGYPDGGLADVPRAELVDKIAAILDEERPDVVATFGPDGITGHPDHITIGQATTEAFLRLAGGPGPGLKRLAYGAIRQSVIDKWNRRRVAEGWSRSTRPSSTTFAECRTSGSTSPSTPRPSPTGPPGHARAPHAVERHEQPRRDRHGQGEARLARDPGDRLAEQRPGRILSDVFEDLW